MRFEESEKGLEGVEIDEHEHEWTHHPQYLRFICLVLSTSAIVTTQGFSCYVDRENASEDSSIMRVITNLSQSTEAFFRSVVSAHSFPARLSICLFVFACFIVSFFLCLQVV